MSSTPEQTAVPTEPGVPKDGAQPQGKECALRAQRYTQPKEKSAELLRIALSHMGKHQAAFNPLTFTVWYEHSAGINPKLTGAIEQLQGKAATVDDTVVASLYREHVAPPDEEAMERIGGQMQTLMAGVAQSASHTGHKAGAFGDQLHGLTQALASQDAQVLQTHVAEVMAGTAEMKASVEALHRKVQTSQDEIHRLREELARASVEALIDPLTGILNRRGFEAQLQSMTSQGSGEHCLVMLDIDHFKKVNDTFGHLVGDRVIASLGDVLRHSLTHPAHAAARYGGEEFALLLPLTSIEQGEQLAEAVRARVKAVRFLDRAKRDIGLSVTISAGVAVLRRGEEAASLVARADGALYEAKRAGRNRVTRG